MSGVFQSVRSASPGRSVLILVMKRNLLVIWGSLSRLCAMKWFLVTSLILAIR